MAANGHQIQPAEEETMKLIIDTDPGIDDSVAIMMAFHAPGVEVLGLTTIFGNCTTAYATRNALILCEKAGHPDVPVAEGSAEPLKVPLAESAVSMLVTAFAKHSNTTVQRLNNVSAVQHAFSSMQSFLRMDSIFTISNGN
uniref:Inosine/uridine-preferring nucleoside hydrolase domain-containing protein n=1 Tax=Aegilops tauschii subsp. strangulata TaxID=200361 RepID=A0A452XS68_AEGTS